MSEQLQTVLAELFKQASTSVGSIIDFGKQEIPELVREFLWYNGAVNVFMSIVIAVVGVIVCRKLNHVKSSVMAKQTKALEDYKNNETWTRLQTHYDVIDDVVYVPSTPSPEYRDIMNANPIILTCAYYAVAGVSTTVALCYAKTACLILIAPRLYLVQVAMDMYKNIH